MRAEGWGLTGRSWGEGGEGAGTLRVTLRVAGTTRVREQDAEGRDGGGGEMGNTVVQKGDECRRGGAPASPSRPGYLGGEAGGC